MIKRSCLIILFSFLFLIFSRIFSQIKFDNVLYGVAYYHEYMPSERLDKDIQMMKDANITVVRVGESTWSLFEPQEGKFEFAWMDRILDKNAAGRDQSHFRHPNLFNIGLDGAKASRSID